jgi:serine/threonine-protein kinase
MSILDIGSKIKETYDIEKFLGEGAFAEVYRVKHRFLGRQSMKVFKKVGMTERHILKMLSEAILLSKIGHPNIIRVYDANVIETEAGYVGYFTMEYVAGGNLQNFWSSYEKTLLPFDMALDIVKQIARGVDIAHKQSPPIIHRDIKPQNILVGYEGDGLRARVSDFGLAKEVSALTLMATVAGTVSYKPPEAFEDLKSDSCASDVWSIVTTFYFLLTNKLPYNFGDSFGVGIKKGENLNLINASDLNPYVDKKIDSIIKKGLHFDPKNRFQTAGDLLVALSDYKKSGLNNDHCEKPEEIKIDFSAKVMSDLSLQIRDKAFQLKDDGKLSEAADLLEEGFKRDSILREKYVGIVKLWRSGISM